MGIKYYDAHDLDKYKVADFRFFAGIIINSNGNYV